MSYGNPCRLRALQICVVQQREGRRDRCARRPPDGEEDGVFTSNKSKKTIRCTQTYTVAFPMSCGNPCRLRALQICVVQQREGRQNRCTRRPPDGEEDGVFTSNKSKKRSVYTNVHRRLFMSYGNPCRLRALQICVVQQREGRRDRCARRPPDGEEDGVFTSNKSKKTIRCTQTYTVAFSCLTAIPAD